MEKIRHYLTGVLVTAVLALPGCPPKHIETGNQDIVYSQKEPGLTDYQRIKAIEDRNERIARRHATKPRR